MAYVSLVAKFREIVTGDTVDLYQLGDIIRRLRNLCATDGKTHKELGCDIALLEDVCKLLETLLEIPTSEETLICIRLASQFIGNLTVGNKQNQLNVHTHCFKVVK